MYATIKWATHFQVIRLWKSGLRTTARTTVATGRPGVRIPVRQQSKAVAATAAPTSTDGPQAPRKREPTIPAVSVFNSELFLDADVEMIDANATHGHGRTVSETMAMDVCADEASTDDDYYDPDPVFVSEYQADIFSYKRELEIKLMPKADFMDYQPQLTWHHRMQMIEWLVQVHERFMLLQETLHLCVNFLDRFMSKEIIRADEFQLMGIVALLLASKYEEIQSPSIHALVTLASNTYTAAEIRSGEVRMLRVLQYDLGHPGPMSFLRRISRVDDYNVDLRTMAKYLVDVTLCDHRFLTVPSSMIAALAYRTSMLLLEWHEGWTEEHVKWSGYTEETLMASINVLLTMLEDPKSTHPALFCKYEDPQLLSPSTYVQNLGVKKLEALHF
ncbi:hypothetical protein BGW42_007114 [Actinomortierella wolfii]|nr:hypothetical protein BGW42_007114 [Actinomortierella wolfii]